MIVIFEVVNSVFGSGLSIVVIGRIKITPFTIFEILLENMPAAMFNQMFKASLIAMTYNDSIDLEIQAMW